jgi:hypothetical protein
MARPPTPPTNWASTGSKITPSAGKVAAGWTVNERPPAEWINYLDNNRDAWLTFLNDCTRGQPIVDLLLNFANTDMFAPLIDVTNAPPASGYRLVQRVVVTGSQHVNVYAGNTARRFVFSYNATWGGSSWICENASQPAVAFALLGDGSQNTFELLWHAATGATWPDSAWGRGNALVNSFSAVAGSFTNLTVTQDLTVQRDILLTRDLTVGRGVTVTEDVHCKNVVVTAAITAPDVTVTGDLTTGPVHVNSAHLYLDTDVDIVHSPPAAAQPYRWVCQDLGNPARWPSAGSVTYDGNYGSWHTTPAGGAVQLEFPLHIHRGTLRITAYAVWQCAVLGAVNKLRLYRWPREFILGGTLLALPSAAVQIGTTLTQAIATPSGCVCDSATFDYDFDPTLERYAFVVELLDGTANYLYSVRLGFADPGPRNG